MYTMSGTFWANLTPVKATRQRTRHSREFRRWSAPRRHQRGLLFLSRPRALQLPTTEAARQLWQWTTTQLMLLPPQRRMNLGGSLRGRNQHHPSSHVGVLATTTHQSLPQKQQYLLQHWTQSSRRTGRWLQQQSRLIQWTILLALSGIKLHRKRGFPSVHKGTCLQQ